MAVIVEFEVPGASRDQLYAAEELAQARGRALGRPPYTGCMFLAVTETDDGFRVVSAWRTEASFRETLESMIGPDFASVGIAAHGITTTTAVTMAIPGAHPA